MGKANGTGAVVRRLRDYYEAAAAPVDAAAKAQVVELAARQASAQAQDAPAGAVANASPLRFALAQLRFIHPGAWLLQLALLAAVLLVAGAAGASEGSMLVVMTGAVLSVAIALPSVFKSFDAGVAELECSCAHDCLQVLGSRLALFGLADVLWLSLVVAAVPAFGGSDPFRVFLYASTPFFGFCAACFLVARRCRRNVAKTGLALALAVVGGLWGVSVLMPGWYGELSLLTWLTALCVAMALAACEGRRLFAQVAEGGATGAWPSPRSAAGLM